MSMMDWRADGINIAWVFNGRALPSHDEIRVELHEAITALIKDNRLPLPPKPAHNLLVNGSFEEGPKVANFVALDPGSTAIKGWTVTRGQIDLCVAGRQGAHGKRSLDLHGSPGYGGIAQTFPTQKGQHYRVTFALAGSPGSDPAVKRIAVSAAGKHAEFAFDSTGTTGENMGWVKYVWEFAAIAEKTKLEFYTLETKDPFGGPALDDVRVEALPGKK